MNKKKTAAILGGKLKDVEEAAAMVAPRFTEGSIHAFRVAVKKLRSLLRLMESGDGCGIRIGKKMKRLYDIAGEIRSAQLEAKKVKRQKASLPGYSQKLKDIIAINKDVWQQEYRASTIKKLARKIEREQPFKLRAKVLVSFLKGHIKVLEDIADGDPDDEQIHTGRKSVKDMLYNAKLAEQHWPKAYAKVSQLPLSKLSHLSDLLGDYNDDRLILESHIAFLPSAKAAEKKALGSLASKEKKLKEEHKLALVKELKRFVTAAKL